MEWIVYLKAPAIKKIIYLTRSSLSWLVCWYVCILIDIVFGCSSFGRLYNSFRMFPNSKRNRIESYESFVASYYS